MKSCCLALALLLIAPLALSESSPPPRYRDTHLPADERARDLVGRMTLPEKIGQMMNDAPAIERLGVPRYNWWNEGLHGVARAGYATTFPQAIGLAATWDPELMHEIGATVGDEARAKYEDAQRHGNFDIYYGLTLWAPNINILRDPRWGRGQETYGEDPFLTGSLAVPFIRGVQGPDPQSPLAIATPKHFAVHSGPEPARHRQNVHPSAHDLWDTYLPAFRAAITQGHAGSLMCSYNSLNGVPACANHFLLEDTLRRDWGFTGFVTSDCGAVDDLYREGAHGYTSDAKHAAAAAVLAGTDTNCGDTYKALTGAVQQGLLRESDLDTSLIRLFTARVRLGMFDGAASPHAHVSMAEVGSAAYRSLALRAARESMVLLVNRNNTLPLNAHAVRKILVTGPNAASLSSLEGNYNATPQSPVLPLDGVFAAFPNTEVRYAQGANLAEGFIVPAPRTLFRPSRISGEHGLIAEYFSTEDLRGKPALTRIDPQIDFDWTAAAPVPGLSLQSYSVRWTGVITAPAPGAVPFSIGFPDCYPCNDRDSYRVYLDEKLVASAEPKTPVLERAKEAARFILSFPDTRPHSIRIEYRHSGQLVGGGFRLDWSPDADALVGEAISQAKDVDAVIAFVGLSPLLEGEEMPIQIAGFHGGDRTDLELPSTQKRLLEELNATGKPLIVVLLNGSAVALNWARQHADAVLEAWYPGEAGGTAIGETLNGVNNPAGRLPMTFYRSTADLPSFDDYAMAGRTYRYFQGEASFRFGDGLSYTSFRFSEPRLSSKQLKAGESLRVQTIVRNIGQADGDAVAEIYLTPPPRPLAPKRALVGLARVHLRAGESRSVELTLDARTLSLVDADGVRAVEPGLYHLYAGATQPDNADPGTPFLIRGRATLPR